MILWCQSNSEQSVVDLIFLFFFKQKTAYEMRISDWSSDVCSSDLHAGSGAARRRSPFLFAGWRRFSRRRLVGQRRGGGQDKNSVSRTRTSLLCLCLHIVFSGKLGEIGRAHV